jgi:hypothetical protein
MCCSRASRCGGTCRAGSRSWARCRSVRRYTGPQGSRRRSSGRHAPSSGLRAHSGRRSRCRRGRLRRGLLRRRGLGGLLGRFRFFSSRQAAEMLAHQFGMLQVNRARVRLFFRDAGFRKVVNQDFRLDLQFPRQLVDPDLIRICHSPLFNSASTRARALPLLENPTPTNILQKPVTARRLLPKCRSLLRALLRWLLPSHRPLLPLPLRRLRAQLPHRVPLRLRPMRLLQ